MTKINITQDQKKIIAAGSVVLFVFLFFWVFFYLPSLSQLDNLKNEFLSTEQQILAIEALATDSVGRRESIRLLKRKQEYLSARLPQKEQESLRFIPEFARKMNIQVISVSPGSKTEFLDEYGKQVFIKRKVVSYLPISMDVNCYYKDLVKYLLDIKDNVPSLVRITSLDVRREDRVSGKIRANIELNLYLLY